MLPSDTPHRDLLRGVIRGACLAAQKNWVAARPYLQTAYDTGCRDLLCLRWLGVTLFASNDFPAAEPVLRQWLAAAPGNAATQKYLETALARIRPALSCLPLDMSAATGSDRRLRIDLPAGGCHSISCPRRAAASRPQPEIRPATRKRQIPACNVPLCIRTFRLRIQIIAAGMGPLPIGGQHPLLAS